MTEQREARQPEQQPVAGTPGTAGSMRLWMDVMRHLEPVMAHHERLFDAWAAGGVDGLVIGPMTCEDKSYTFDPNPEVYRESGKNCGSGG